MSLTKTLQQATGNDATYWQITEIVVNPRIKRATVNVAGFKDKTAFDGGADPMGNYRFRIDQTILTDESNTTWLPAMKTCLRETQLLGKDLIEDLADATSDDTDVV